MDRRKFFIGGSAAGLLAFSGRIHAATDWLDLPARLSSRASSRLMLALAKDSGATGQTLLAAGQRGIGGDQSEHIPGGRRAVEAQQQVGRAEVEKAQGMGLDDLAQVHQAAQFFGAGRDLDGEDRVARLGGGQQMADRADAAHARSDAGHFPEGPPLAKPLETAKLGHMKPGVRHIARIIQVDGDLGVSFNPGDGVNYYPFSHNKSVP